jgi:hypothetical protein
VGTLLRQGHRLLAPHQPLRRIATYPQRQRGKAVTHHTRVVPIAQRSGAVLLGVVQGYPLRQMRVRSSDRSQLVQCHPQGTVCRHEHGSVLDLLRQREELIAQSMRGLQLGTHVIMHVQAT